MQILIFALCTALCSPVLAQPYTSEITWISATTTSTESLWPTSEPTEVAHLYGKRGYRDILQARDTTATTDEATSRTDEADSTTDTPSETTSAERSSSEITVSETTSAETTSETTKSETTTSTTESTTASPTSETTTETPSTSPTPTSTTETPSSSSLTSSTPTTVSTSTTTSSTSPTSTGKSAAELAEWNRKGNIAAIVFGCCFISFFLIVCIVYYLSSRAKARRIAASKLSSSNDSYSKIPLVAINVDSPSEPEVNRSSPMPNNNPQTEYYPTGGSPSVSNYSAPSGSNYSHAHSMPSPMTPDQASHRDYSLRGQNNEQWNTRIV
ncbi:uncharacterized protein N7479_007948 [Penicillium vulpinum]|uniref:Mid2 domain-containing protein n=1 Tax=Penicillium vulpinum TaxID=29845 RepID=A0A1V6RLG5_9EURO|nr:uncharacterized protein N7479_007948 [Penicillium vulpinum]KAJ5960798.1 hypothetical protein N7479_007948 [Penicillium vulpinum]OQE02681.1 hypothetical protein PENVUL_c039G02778 [Penicillium vulpinum]